MTWQLIPKPKPWNPPPAPRIVNRGIQGGTYTLDQADGQWKSVLKLQSKCPDAPSAAGNDHFRTIYVQQTTCAPLIRTAEDTPTLVLGVVLRFSFGIGNGKMKTIYDVCSNGIVHAAITGESVEVDAATVQVFFPATDSFQECGLDEPTPIRADAPPTITIGVVQDQALAMNQIATPKRMLTVETHADTTATNIPIPPGAQSVLVVGDPLTVTAEQLLPADTHTGVPLAINVETPLVAGAYLVGVASSGGSEIVGVIFGLGI